MKSRFNLGVKVIYFCLYSAIFHPLSAQNSMTECNDVLIQSIMEDNFNPPVASRVHLYANVASYEVYCKKNATFTSLSNASHLPKVEAPKDKINYDIAAAVAFIKTAINFIYTEDALQNLLTKNQAKWAKQYDNKLVESSIDYGNYMAKSIIEWSKGDVYNHTRTLRRHEVNDSLGAWQPTPPEYKDGLEPHWRMIRKITLPNDSFMPFRHHDCYNEAKNSRCYQLMDSVYTKWKYLTEEEKTIALYWDDNPMTTINKGHVMYVEKKPSPLGHWLKLTGQTIRNKKMNAENASRVYTLVSIAGFEGFINCWNAKYTLNTIRPETYIHRLIDPNFKPFIETPPFPEYTSGHSTVSAAVSTVLDNFFPKINRFTDSSQIALGMKPRTFTSFRQAAREASNSRFYGGIHITTALREGEKMGKAIGTLVWTKFMPIRHK